MNILLIGSGGREAALAMRLSLSPSCQQLYIAPGNPGTVQYGVNVALDVNDAQAVAHYCHDHDISLVVIGPEGPLVDGLADTLRQASISVMGPGRDGARLEGSKDWAKAFMTRHRIPTAAYRTFGGDQADEAHKYLEALPSGPYVLKADGLAAGKGVIISPTLAEAHATLDDMLGGRFGQASARVVIEQFLEGRECSVFVITDGQGRWRLLPVAKDYKRRYDCDLGPNTGGMGSVSPVAWADQAFMTKVRERIIEPTIGGLGQEGIDYRGFIFLGLINVGGDPYVIEYNARMGDPETQSVMLRVDGDFARACRACADGTLTPDIRLLTDPRTAVTVVVVTGTYPGSCAKGMPIQGIAEAQETATVFQAGTVMDTRGDVCANGGRVLAVSALAPTLEEAIDTCYAAARTITWAGSALRADIGHDLL